MVRIGPLYSCWRFIVPLGQSYHQSASRSPLYSPQSGGPNVPSTPNVRSDGSTLMSAPPPSVVRTTMSPVYCVIMGLVVRELLTTTLPVRRDERGSIR